MAGNTRTLTIRWLGDVKNLVNSAKQGAGAVKGFGTQVQSSGSKALGTLGKLGGTLSGFGVPFAAEAGHVVQGLGKIGSKGAALKTALLAGTGAIAAGLGKVAIESIHVADEYEKAHARLETAVANTGHDFEAYEKQIHAANDALENLGFTHADTESSLAKLTTATGDADKATRLMGLAADIARGRNTDLETATTALVRVEGGRYSILGRLLGLSKDQIAAIHNEHDALALLTKLYGGQAQAYASTFAGKLDVLKARGKDLEASIGLALIPTITEFVDITNSAIQTVGDADTAFRNWEVGNVKVGKSISDLAFHTNILKATTDLWSRAIHGTPPWEPVHKDAGKQVTDLDSAVKKYTKDLSSGHATQDQLAADSKAVADAQANQHGVQEAVTSALDEGTEAAEGNKKTTKELADEAEAAAKKLDLERDAVLGVADAQLRNDKTQRDLSDDLADYGVKLKDVADKHWKNVDANKALVDVSDKVKGDFLEVARNAAQLAQKQAELHGKTWDSAQAAYAQRDALNKIKAQIPPGSPFRVYLDQLIGQFDALAKQRTGSLSLRVYVNDKLADMTNPTVRKLVDERGALIPHFQEGGLVPGQPGSAVPAVLHAGEYVLPRNEVQSQRNGGGPAARTHNTYNITQHIAAGVDPAAVGKATVDAIRAYEARNGASWRRH